MVKTKTLNDLLIELEACSEAVEWAEEMTIEEVVKNCQRGDWLLWLAKRIDIPLKPLTKAKALCALTVRHLMKDERSIKACEVALKFSEGKATRKQLGAAYAAAYAAADAAADAAAAAAAYAAAAAAYAAAYAAYAAYAADADAAAAAYAADADADADAARKKSRLQTADICREVLGELIIKKVNKLL